MTTPGQGAADCPSCPGVRRLNLRREENIPLMHTARKTELDDRDLARVIHTLHWSVNFGLGDTAPAPPFDTLTPEQQKPLLRLVEHIKTGGGPAEAQDMWIAHMASLGFEPGKIKDPTATPPTHPDMV